jgi:hypothetical protein
MCAGRQRHGALWEEPKVANQDHLHGDAVEPVIVVPEPAAPLRADGMSRRRFASLGASGVILTVASQPAMANSVMCTALSAPGSVMHSRSTTVLKCEGRSPGYYHKPENWGGTGVDPNGMFKDYFSTVGLGGLLVPYTLLEVITGDFDTKNKGKGKDKPGADIKPDQNNVARHIVATWLNVLSNRVSFFTVESVMAMWTEYATTSHYVPTAGAPAWDGTTLVKQLTDRMI